MAKKNANAAEVAVAPVEEVLSAVAEASVAADEAAAPAAEEAAPVAAPVVTQHPVQATLEGLSEAIRGVREKLHAAEALMKVLTREAKKLCKKRGSSNKPSNLTLPLAISEKLADFLGKERDEKMTRGQVTAAINQYAKTNNIKHPDNGRVIVLDEKLAEVLGKAAGDHVEIINLQSHLRGHYIKPEAAVVPVA